MGRFFVGALLLTVLLGTGCTRQTLYQWDDYDSNLYSYYQNPAQREQFVEEVYRILYEADKAGRVPPGLFAEYGYLLYEAGSYPEAVVYFKKEQELWPESSFFMDKMIRNANRAGQRNSKNPVEEPGLLQKPPGSSGGSHSPEYATECDFC